MYAERDMARLRRVLAVGDGSARLNGVDHQHELTEGECAAFDGVLHGIALVCFDVDVELAQHVDVGVDALALGADAVCCSSD